MLISRIVDTLAVAMVELRAYPHSTPDLEEFREKLEDAYVAGRIAETHGLLCGGAYGQFYIDGESGDVISLKVPTEYADHVRADLTECRAWYERNGWKFGPTLDVVEVGWWLRDRSYLAPSEEFRRLAELRGQEQRAMQELAHWRSDGSNAAL